MQWFVLFLLTACSAAAAVEGPEWVQQQVEKLQPAAKEKRFDEIGWAHDIREAKRLAKEHQRPVFLFTHDGRMNIGRC